MIVPRTPHRWSVSPRRAIEVQRKLASRVIDRGRVAGPALVAGADLAFSRDGSRCIAAVIVWDVRQARVVEQRVAQRRVTFPYVPGLLSFREIPALLAAIRRLRTEPDVFLFDGQGFAHPRRFGLACHIGVILDRPAIGCAKSRLVGRHDAVGPRRGDTAALLDGPMPPATTGVPGAMRAAAGAGMTLTGSRDAELIGAVLRTRDGVKPVYVSVGHRVSLDEAVRVVLACAVRFRLPEPTRLADRRVAALRTLTRRQVDVRAFP